VKYSRYGGIPLSAEARLACDDAMAETKVSLDHYQFHIDAVLANPALSTPSRKFLRELWYGDFFDVALTLTCRAVSEARTRAIVLALLEEAERDPTAIDGPTKYRMLTNCADLGVTMITGGSLNPVGVGNQYDQTMRHKDMKLHGVNCLDVALMHDFGTWQPDWVSLHSHAAVRSFNLDFKPVRAAKAACPERAPQNRFGADVVHLSSRADNYRGLMRIAHLGRCVSEISCGTKYPVQGQLRRRTVTSQRYWHWQEALRGLEVYSHLDPLSTMRGVGEGKALRSRTKELFQYFLRVERLPYGQQIDHARPAAQWQRLYNEFSSPYSAFIV
jgi:hypothetical protein